MGDNAVKSNYKVKGGDDVKVLFSHPPYETWAATKTGMPSELVRSDMEKQQVIMAGAQASAAQAGIPPEAMAAEAETTL